jgi:hypothetical protein
MREYEDIMRPASEQREIQDQRRKQDEQRIAECVDIEFNAFVRIFKSNWAVENHYTICVIHREEVVVCKTLARIQRVFPQYGYIVSVVWDTDRTHSNVTISW